MRITLESTTRDVEIYRAKGKVWEGMTDNGLRVVVVVTRMAVSCNETRELLAEAGIHHAPFGPLTDVEPSPEALEAFFDAVPFTGWPLSRDRQPEQKE